MNRPLSLQVLAVWATLITVLLGGCAHIPTSGPVVAGGGPTRLPEVSVEVEPEPPRPGATPRAVVEGYLQAMANYQPGYSVARLYLASDVRDTWRPETGVTVYEDGYGVTATTQAVALDAPVVGRVGTDGSFAHSGETVRHEFGMARDRDGEWRIRNPPAGLLISRYLFETFYQSVSIYFFDPGWTAVVADTVFLPTGNRTATALLQALLRGPSDWLAPVVVTAVPSQTRLNVQSAFIDPDGVVEVSLNETIAALGDEQRSRLAGQLAWTLGQLPGVTGVRLLMNGSPYSVPEAEEGVARIEAYSWLNPMPPARPVSTFGVTTGGLVRIGDSAGETELIPVSGPWGTTPRMSAVAVDRTQDRVAALNADRTVLWTGSMTGGVEETRTGQGFLRPQFVGPREPELWTILDASADQPGQIAHRIVQGRVETVPLSALGDGAVLAYRISPDGTRLAAVRRTAAGRLEVGLARINRTQPDVIVDGWRALPLADAGQPGPQIPVDVGWWDATTLIVLAAEDERQQPKPYRLDEYAAEVIEIGQPDNWQAEAVAAAPRMGGGPVLVLGRNGAWRYEADYRWLFATRDLVAVTHAG